MKTKVEGLILNKTDFQERHLICSVLLRTGKKVSILFYGGQGGGKKIKPTQLEIGAMLEIELSVSKRTSDVHRAKEWKTLWKAQRIRTNHKAFILLCAICEIVSKIIGEEDLHHDELTQEHEGIFRVVSNALFYLEKSLELEQFNLHKEFTIFLGKLLGEQGVFPQRENCCLCGLELCEESISTLSLEHGGFTCSACSPRKADFSAINDLWFILGPIGSQKYPELIPLKLENNGVSRHLMDYFLYQFHLEASSFKSLSMVFQL
jgi:DNA repair protein RecO